MYKNEMGRAHAQWVSMIIVLMSFVLPQCGFTQTESKATTPSSVTTLNYESKGNLVVTNVLKCTNLDKMKTDYSPADIYPAFADCVVNERYQDATQLFMFAGAYAYYDTLRVTDVSAHQAKSVLILNAMAAVDAAKKEAWATSLSAYLTGGGLVQSCAAIKRIGPPTYYPTYMIQHGIDAFSPGKSAPLVEPFDGAASWQKTLTTYLQCPF